MCDVLTVMMNIIFLSLSFTTAKNTTIAHSYLMYVFMHIVHISIV
jgi:hypothetical protein